MGGLTKIHIRYELKEPFPLFVEPGSPVEGRMIITNTGEKDLKLKELYIDLMERYETDSDEGWQPIKHKLNSYRINTMGVIRAKETQLYPFQIILSRWKRRKGRRIMGWHIELQFKQKTKMIASRGLNKKDATCILPAPGSMVPPSFGDPNVILGKKKKNR